MFRMKWLYCIKLHWHSRPTAQHSGEHCGLWNVYALQGKPDREGDVQLLPGLGAHY